MLLVVLIRTSAVVSAFLIYVDIHEITYGGQQIYTGCSVVTGIIVDAFFIDHKPGVSFAVALTAVTSGCDGCATVVRFYICFWLLL